MPARTDLIRAEIQRLLRQVPFRPFVLSLENGDRVPIGHPENIAFDPGTNGSGGSAEFYVIAGAVRLFSSFDAITSVSLLQDAEV
jgi:hypothetical protein